MQILVINSGSSTIKADVISTATWQRDASLRIDRVHEAGPRLTIDGKDVPGCPGPGHGPVLAFALPKLLEAPAVREIIGVGHRVVHGGERFSRPVRIDAEVEQAIHDLSPLAPLHNPVNLTGIKTAKKLLPDVSHVAVFDTAFHHTLPNRARYYALPHELAKKHGYRRFGFHGTSHAFVARRAAEFLEADLRSLRLITCHLGNGCSMTAVEFGRSVETTMGMTPLEGLVMGTRVGDVDPGILLALMREQGLSVDELDRLLNKESGLKGLSGIGNDMRDIIAEAADGNEACRMALHVFTHRIRKYIGAYAAVMDGVDAIVFTGGIGENSAVVRQRCAQRLDYLGALIDEDANRMLRLGQKTAAADFARPHSRVRLLAVATDEQREIAEQTAALIREQDKVNTVPTIPVAISARHVHLRQETVEALFGEGYRLTERNPLSQPGQFACNETVTLVGPKNSIEKVRILGPVRSKDQVEISRTDEFYLGIDAPVRASGHVAQSPGITLVGTKGQVTLKEGLICAWRHIHMTPEDAKRFGVEDKDVVEVEVPSEARSLTFGNVLVRVSPKYKLEMHIDTDEANAAELSSGASGVLTLSGSSASLRKKRV